MRSAWRVPRHRTVTAQQESSPADMNETADNIPWLLHREACHARPAARKRLMYYGERLNSISHLVGQCWPLVGLAPC